MNIYHDVQVNLARTTVACGAKGTTIGLKTRSPERRPLTILVHIKGDGTVLAA